MLTRFDVMTFSFDISILNTFDAIGWFAHSRSRCEQFTEPFDTGSSVCAWRCLWHNSDAI